jgi:hypothetical protein
MQLPQTTDAVLMIRPVRFSYNTQTAESNAFQSLDESSEPDVVQEKALAEFDNFVDVLRKNGIMVVVVEDTPEPHKPDSIFPNNWATFHCDGNVILYPMQAPNRRGEKRRDILDILRINFVIDYELDLSGYEPKNIFLEGTGSMVLEHQRDVCYACLSPRTSRYLLDLFAAKMLYEIVDFEAFDDKGKLIYHTNVMMCVAIKFVVICLDAIKNEAERQKVVDRIVRTKKEIITISMEQMNHFAGNMLAMHNKAEESLLVMSEQAYKSLDQSQIERIEKYSRIIHVPLYTIEKHGGGSARCMLSEIFLSKK